ncbi:MAG TPA: hypothetical protein VFO37_00695 [Chitinophagaceae bacterium]|nr:hypothetical protein [Chitinophagaceae bacterium]
MEDKELQIKQLQSEVNTFKDLLTRTNAEKTALDHMFGESVQKEHRLKTEFLLKDAEINRLKAEIEDLKKAVEKAKMVPPPVSE